jgi:hypothetical protein
MKLGSPADSDPSAELIELLRRLRMHSIFAGREALFVGCFPIRPISVTNIEDS